MRKSHNIIKFLRFKLIKLNSLAYLKASAGPDGLFSPVVRVPVRSVICHQGCAYTVIQTVQRPGVFSVVFGTLHCKEPLKSFEKSRV